MAEQYELTWENAKPSHRSVLRHSAAVSVLMRPRSGPELVRRFDPMVTAAQQGPEVRSGETSRHSYHTGPSEEDFTYNAEGGVSRTLDVKTSASAVCS
jgi:hypothetical protein